MPSEDINVHLYADDSQIYYSTPISKIDSCSAKINHSLSLISSWAQLNKITVNPAKSMAMVVSNKKIDNPPPIIFDGKTIPYVEKVKSLGLTLNNSLTFSDHISKLCGDISHCIGMLYQSKSFTPFKTRLKLFQALIMPKFLYLSNIYHNCSRKCWDLINVTYNKCARYVFNIHLFSSVSKFSFKLLNCTLRISLSSEHVFTFINCLNLNIQYIYMNCFHFLNFSAIKCSILPKALEQLNLDRHFLLRELNCGITLMQTLEFLSPLRSSRGSVCITLPQGWVDLRFMIA